MTLLFLRRQFESIRAACDAALEMLSEMDACTHPKASRQDIGGISDDEHWACGECGYEFKKEEPHG